MPDCWCAWRLCGEKSHKSGGLLRWSHQVSLGSRGVARCWKSQLNSLCLRSQWYTYAPVKGRASYENVFTSLFHLPPSFLFSSLATYYTFLPLYNFPRAFHFHQVVTINQDAICGRWKGGAETLSCKAEHCRFTAGIPLTKLLLLRVYDLAGKYYCVSLSLSWQVLPWSVPRLRHASFRGLWLSTALSPHQYYKLQAYKARTLESEFFMGGQIRMAIFRVCGFFIPMFGFDMPVTCRISLAIVP